MAAREALRGLVDRLFEPVDIASSAMFRILFGLCVLIGAVRYLAYGWTRLLYIEPGFHFTYPGFDWVQPLPGIGMYAVYAFLAACAVAVMLGWRYRLAIVGLLATFTYIELLDKAAYLNHYYLVSLIALLLCFLPVEGAWSIDAWRDPSRRRSTVPRWVVWLLRGQLGLVYVFAGVAKLNREWLVEGLPLAIWLPTKTDLVPLVGPWLDQPWVAQAMSVSGALFDLAIFPLLLWKKTRRFAYLAVLGFHLATGWLFHIGMFPVIMATLTLIFFDPDWPRRGGQEVTLTLRARAEDRAQAVSGRGQEVTLTPFVAESPRHRTLVLAALAAWFAVQIAVPLRPLLYPGDVRWTAEGMRFGWRVLMVEERGWFKYRVVDPETGQRWVVDPLDHVTERQRHAASSRPDMILHLAHHLRDQWAARGHDDVEVYADAWLSLNGAPARRFIDPSVDLAAEPRWTLRPWHWVARQPPRSARWGRLGP